MTELLQKTHDVIADLQRVTDLTRTSQRLHRVDDQMHALEHLREVISGLSMRANGFRQNMWVHDSEVLHFTVQQVKAKVSVPPGISLFITSVVGAHDGYTESYKRGEVPNVTYGDDLYILKALIDHVMTGAVHDCGASNWVKEGVNITPNI